MGALEQYMGDRLQRGVAAHGEKFDPSSLAAASELARHYAHGLRVKVQRTYGDGETVTRTGRISTTTGWRPAFLLVHRRSDHGSSDLLGPDDKVVAVQRRPAGGPYMPERF